MCLPSGEMPLPCNANCTLPELFAGADYRPRVAVATIANAMNVGATSTFNPLRWTFEDDAQLRQLLHPQRVGHETIRGTALRRARQFGEIAFPQTATAFAVLDRNR